MQEESGLFQVRINDQGKKFIRKFAAISYTMLVMVVFQACVSIYWGVRMLTHTAVSLATYSRLHPTLYDKVYPYISILFSILGLVANVYYLRFPGVLLHSMEIGDEYGANKAFGMLYKGVLVFLFYLLISSLMMIWNLVIR
jgi:hypothetical protein